MSRIRLTGFSAARLRTLRAANQLGQVDLATLAGVSVHALRVWETGRGTPTPPHAAALAAALHVTVRDLLDLNEDDIGLIELRQLQGMDRNDLAQRIGMRPPALGYIERGHTLPTPEQCERIAAALGHTADQVMSTWEHVRRKLRHRHS